MTKKAFIFDLDGVIVDTAKYHYLAWKKLAESLGISFSEEDNEQLKGVSRVQSLKKILTWGNKELHEDKFMELLALKNNDYLEYIATMNEDEILPDVKRVLTFFLERDQAIALGSASKNARKILKEVKLYNAFQAIVDGNDVSMAKPNPEVFLKAARELGVAPEDAIVFEDSLAGIQAANTAGMVSVGIGKPEILKEANYVFSDFTEISNEFLNNLIDQ